MKFLRVFETEQERQSIVSQLEYNTLSLAGGVLLIHTASDPGPGPVPVYDHYIGTINAEEDWSFKILAGGESGEWDWQPDKVIVDGVELEKLSEHIDLTSGLHTIEIYDNPENKGYYTTYNDSGYFHNCAYSSMIIPDYVTTMHYTFYGCGRLTSVTIPNSVTSIGDSAFSGCSGLTSVTIPNSVISIGSAAFYGCSGLTSVTIPNSVTSIGDSAFYDCIGLTSVTIPESVTSIDSRAFWDCSGLTSVTIPNSVTSIGSSAFTYCSGLTSVTIPNSVTSIGSSAFTYCSGLTSITCNAVIPPTLGSTTFSNTNNCPIYVPASSVDAYKAANNWSAYASRIQAIQ